MNSDVNNNEHTRVEGRSLLSTMPLIYQYIDFHNDCGLKKEKSSNLSFWGLADKYQTI